MLEAILAITLQENKVNVYFGKLIVQDLSSIINESFVLINLSTTVSMLTLVRNIPFGYHAQCSQIDGTHPYLVIQMK